VRTTAVSAEQAREVDAAPERVWPLLSSPAAWSLRRCSYAFDVLEPSASTRRLWCWLGPGDAIPTCAVLEIAEEAPGAMIRLRRRDRFPGAEQAFTLSIRPAPRGATARIAVRDVVPRKSKADWTMRWETDLGLWLDALQAVVEGRRPWPGPGLPEDVRQACWAVPAAGSYDSVSATALIRAPLDVVWEAVWSPETTRLLDPAVVASGIVPGTPERAAGELQYSIRYQADGRITGCVLLVRELADQHSTLTESVSPLHAQVHHLVTPAADGVHLTLTTRWPQNW